MMTVNVNQVLRQLQADGHGKGSVKTDGQGNFYGALDGKGYNVSVPAGMTNPKDVARYIAKYL